VLGASGIVGQVAVQAARLLGAGRVTAACRDAYGRARATELGADAVADLTADDANTLAARLAEAVARRPTDQSRLVGSPLAALGSATLRSGTLSVLGYTNNALSHGQKAQALAEILRHAAAGISRPTARRCLSPTPRRAGRDAASRRTGAPS
jgi:NADPH:quinone reductase-like Zn-dependent oxidoreductase